MATSGFRLGIYVCKDAEIVDFAAPHGVWAVARRFDPELEAEWTWSEKYATQPEILRYLQLVAERYDLRRDITFETRVVGAEWDDAASTWTVLTNREHILRWAWSTYPRSEERVRDVLAAPDPPVVVRLRTRDEVRAWLAGPVAQLAGVTRAPAPRGPRRRRGAAGRTRRTP